MFLESYQKVTVGGVKGGIFSCKQSGTLKLSLYILYAKDPCFLSRSFNRSIFNVPTHSKVVNIENSWPLLCFDNAI